MGAQGEIEDYLLSRGETRKQHHLWNQCGRGDAKRLISTRTLKDITTPTITAMFSCKPSRACLVCEELIFIVWVTFQIC